MSEMKRAKIYWPGAFWGWGASGIVTILLMLYGASDALIVLLGTQVGALIVGTIWAIKLRRQDKR